MPYINIKITKEAVTNEQKELLVSKVTEMMKTVLGKDPKTTFVIIEEIECSNWGIDGTLVNKKRSC